MIQFTHNERIKYQARAKKDPTIISWLLNETKVIRENPLIIPQTGCATWSLYYYCPHCSVPLLFDPLSPKEYTCPLCGTHYKGEPYEGGWWRRINSLNYEGAYHLGLLYLLTEKKEYLERSKKILTTYAHYYPHYQEHGGIPYNGPGKANAQTLCESNFLRYFGYAYDLIADDLTAEEQTFIEKNLLEEGLNFLLQHRKLQLHNHEVIWDCSVGVLSLILKNTHALDIALHSKYGITYQLEHAVMEDGFWFEGSTAYHFYALKSLFDFEKFALHTPYSQLQNPNYRKMLNFPFHLLQENYRFPLLNDTHVHQGKLNNYQLFEFAYKTFREEKFIPLLLKVRSQEDPINRESFFYGVEEIPQIKTPLQFSDYHNENGSGLTIIRNKENQQTLLIKNGRYGGEHDHYDRLAFSYTVHGIDVSADLGTTGYGALLHYDYYKNTGTHNTVMINEGNQPPRISHVKAYNRSKSATYIDSFVDFNEAPYYPDSFTIKQWDEKPYEGALFERQILKEEDYFIDVFTVSKMKNEGTIDYVLHLKGDVINPDTKEGNFPSEWTSFKKLSDKKPFNHLSHLRKKEANGLSSYTYKVAGFEHNKPFYVTTQVFSYATEGSIIRAEGPDNPSNKNLQFLIERVKGKSATFVHLITSNVNNSPYVTLDTVSIIHKVVTMYCTIQKDGIERKEKRVMKLS